MSSAPRRRLGEALPRESRKAAQLRAEAGCHHGRRVDDNGKRDRALLPTHRHREAVVAWLVERVEELFLHGGIAGRDRKSQLILLLVVEEAAPRPRFPVENDRPLAGGRDHVQPVTSGGDLLARDRDVAAERDHRVLVRTCAPDFAVGNERSPNRALVD